jgi:hypothetical protein
MNYYKRASTWAGSMVSEIGEVADTGRQTGHYGRDYIAEGFVSKNRSVVNNSRDRPFLILNIGGD